MCRYNDECDAPCVCLHRTENGATTDCCNQLVPEEDIGVAPPKDLRYAAVCDECGVIQTTEGHPSGAKIAVSAHEDSHDANWGMIR